MSDRDFSDFGREIQEKIKTFVDSQEFRDLQENIRVTVDHTMREVQRSARDAADFLSRNAESGWQSASGEQTSNDRRAAENAAGNIAGQNMPWLRRRQLPVVKKPPGSITGGLLSLAGACGAVLAWAGVLAGLGITFLGDGIIAGAYDILGTAYTGQLISFLSALGRISLGAAAALACAFTAAACAGGAMRRRAKRFKLYMKAIGKKEYYPVEELALAVGKSEKFVIRDLKKMTDRRWFREGHLDEQGTCFMLTDETYRMYLDTQAELKRRKEEAERQKREQETLDQDPVRKQLKIAIEEGKEYIRRIRSVNDQIPGEEISGKLNRLESVCTKIFEYLDENPAQLPDSRKFMNYYLPTTLKLVETYYEFSIQPVRGENITTAQREIEDMLDQINQAFEKMYDKMFEQSAMDISTDITVLSAMLAQEGLLEDEFK